MAQLNGKDVEVVHHASSGLWDIQYSDSKLRSLPGYTPGTGNALSPGFKAEADAVAYLENLIGQTVTPVSSTVNVNESSE